MNDIKYLINNLTQAKKNAEFREIDPNIINELISVYRKLNSEKTYIQDLQAKTNKISKSKSISIDEKRLLIKKLKKHIKKANQTISLYKNKYKNIMDNLPNLDIVHNKTKMNEAKIKEIYKKDKLKRTGLPHWEIYKKMNLVNFEWGTRTGGSRLVVYFKNGAKLRRAIMNYQIDNAVKMGFVETMPPSIVSNEAMYNSAHFPKFKDDVFRIENDNLTLPGSSETTICNFFSNQIIDTNKLPLRFSATTLNFRSEVGSAGRDVRGCNRMKQFTKTELFTFCEKKFENKEFELMIETAKNVLKSLELPFKIICLPQNDISFSSKITYDFEVWMPGEETFKEVSSISKVGDFQARRARIRHRPNINSSTELCYTLNGTAVAVDRLMACIAETYYDKKTNTIKLPKILAKYYSNNVVD